MANSYDQMKMQSDYADEESMGAGGLYSLLRAGGEYLVGGEVMDLLPEISRAFDESAAMERAVRRGPSEQGDALTMRIEEIRAQPLDEGMAYNISQAQGLESLLSPELAMVVGATGPGKKGEGIQAFIELLKSMNVKPNQSILDEAKSLKDLSDEYLKDLGKKNTERDIEQTRYQQGTVPDDTRYPEGHPFRDWGKSKTQLDKERKAREAKDDQDAAASFFSDLEDMQKDKPPILGGRKEIDPTMRYVSRQEKRAALGEEGMKRIQALLAQRRSKMAQMFGPERDKGMGFKKEQQLLDEVAELERKLDPYYSPSELNDMDYFAEGGAVRRGDGGGLYANIHAKRKRIAAGSGERMRKKGEKGAPTAENFKQAAKTAKRGTGGLAYKKGYYGKSYK